MRNSRTIIKLSFSVVLIAVLFSSTIIHAQDSYPRTKESLIEWQFCQDTSKEGSQIQIPTDAAWQSLTIPHVFRLSGLHEQSAGWYKRTIDIGQSDMDKCLYIFLEGAGSVVDLFVNGKHIGQHKGAFTAAAFDITGAVNFAQENTLMIRVTNRDTEAANCLSQSNLFYTNGGLYRPVWLIKTGKVHIYPDMGSTGIYLTPKNIGKDKADLQIETFLTNTSSNNENYTLRYSITSPNGDICTQSQVSGNIAAGTTGSAKYNSVINDPILWDIGKPNLYTVSTQVVVDGKVCDELTERTGIRTVRMQDGCFMINDKELLARGVCKHHQGEHQWNAMSDDDLRQEMDMMVDLGCNTIRLAHYPHRHFEYNLADEHGIAIWAENGLAGQKWDSGIKRETKPNADGERITREMVRQNWNHPCIVFWSSGNETYQEVASHYADIIRAEDDTRLITYASAGEVPSNVDFVAGNTYQGWYYDHYTNFKMIPKNAYVSETGSGSWITQHIPYGQIKWHVDYYEPEEYNELFSEFRFQTIFKNNPSAHKMFLWWNFREFYNKKFKNNRNTKGILTLAFMPKDYYYHYKSFLRPDEPILHLCGRHFFYRQFAPDNGIKAYSNASQVEMFINGISQGIKKNGEYFHPDSTIKEDGKEQFIKGPMINNVFFWKAPLNPGKNLVKVVDDQGNSESTIIYQKPADGPMPVAADSLVVDLKSSNPENPAIFIDRPVESQGPFYTEVDGSSDNTFDILPDQVAGSAWIATKRLSDEKNNTNISFTVTEPSDIFVMYANGTFPAHTLNEPDQKMIEIAASLKEELMSANFKDTGIVSTWRRHNMWLGYCDLMSRQVEPGENITIKGHTLDYVILVRQR